MEIQNIFSFLFQITTWIIIIIGWVVVHWLTLKRETRKEVREGIDAFLKLLQNIEAKAISFHRADEYKGDIARALRFDIQRAIAGLDRQLFSKFTIPSSLRVGLRKAVTLTNFERGSFAPVLPDSQILNEICHAVDDIEQQIEKEYERIYPLGIKWRFWCS